MNVLVIGANGQIGRHLMSELEMTKDLKPIAALRKEEQIKDFQDRGYQTQLLDLEQSVDELTTLMKDVDAVVFTAGSGGNTGADQTVMIDLDGAVKSVEAAQEAGVSRFVQVSAMNSDQRERWSEGGAGDYYFAAKYYADKALENSSLAYTVVRPSGLTNDPGTGKISVGPNLPSGTIAREDVAKTIIAVLQNDQTIGQSFDLSSGDQPIDQALK